MDDTIIAFEHGIDLDACWKKVCCLHIEALDDARTDELLGAIKGQAKWYWSDSERHRTGRLDLEKARTEIIAAALARFKLYDASAANRIAIDYGLERDKAVTLHPGAIETITYIRTLGIKLALITNGASSAQRQKINRFKLAGLFEHIFIEEEFGVGKPDSSIYLHAVKQLGVTPEEAWMIGDNFEWEVIAPQQIGIKGIWINPKGIDPASFHHIQPYQSINTINDLVHILNGI